MHRLYGLSIVALLPGLVVIACPVLADDVGRPGQWVQVDGQDDTWLTATAGVRQLLEQLDAADPKLQRWLPAVRHRAAHLHQVPVDDPKFKIAYVDFFEAMLEDLVDGRPPLTRYAGQTVPYAWFSDHMQTTFGTRIQVPADYDPSREYQVFLYYKLGGGLIWRKKIGNGRYQPCGPESPGAEIAPPYRPAAEMCHEHSGDTFHVWSAQSSQTKGRMLAHVEVDELSNSISRDFAVSRDRVFLTGFSDGGFTSWWLGATHPHLVAGVLPEVANWQYVNVNHVGLMNVPVLVVDGWFDGGYVGENFTRLHLLWNMGHRQAGGIFGHHGHATLPYEHPETFKFMLDWAKQHRRNLYPKTVHYATWNLDWHRAYWFSIERMVEPLLAAKIEAEVKTGNVIDVKAVNLAEFRLLLADPAAERLGLDKTKPLTVRVNGRNVFSGPIADEILVDVAKLPRGEMLKTPRTPGDIKAVMKRNLYGGDTFMKVPGEPWIFVAPTGGDGPQRAALLTHVPAYARPDTDVTDQDIARANFVIYGGPGLNKLADRMADRLPVKFETGKFTIGAQVFDQPQQCVKFICPNPLNPQKHVVIYGFNDTTRGRPDRYDESGWGFRDGDAVVFGVTHPHREWGTPVTARIDTEQFIFDSNFQPPDPTPIAQATAPFDLTAIAQLEAEAIQYATGADAGLVVSYPRGWNRWKTWVDKGPVTLNDVATTHMFPRFVCTAQVDGATLKWLVTDRTPIGSTVFTSQDQPGYNPTTSLLLDQIDPDKRYTIAIDYDTAYDNLSSSGEPAKMPQPYHVFHNLAEFEAPGFVRSRGRHLRQLDLQMSEAVVRYVKQQKKGRLAPKPKTNNLAFYISNPVQNRFDRADWLHIKTPMIVGHFDNAHVTRRDIIAIGIDVPGASPHKPRGNTQHFATWETNQDAGFSYDMNQLAGRLPIKVSAEAELLMVTGGRQPGDIHPLGLAPLDQGEAGVGHAVRIPLQLTNTGDKPLTGRVCLSTRELHKPNGGILPNPLPKEGPRPSWRAIVDHVGDRRKPQCVHFAAMIVGQNHPREDRLILPNVGYNAGLVGMHHPIALDPGKTVTVPIVLLSVNSPDPKDHLPIDANRVTGEILGEALGNPND